MALADRIYRVTDTGGGTRAATNTSQEISYTKPSSQAYAAAASAAASRSNTSQPMVKGPSSTPQQAAQQPVQSAPQETASSGSGGSGGGGGGSAETEYKYDNWNNYLNAQNKIIENEYKGEKNSAVDYLNAANANAAKSEEQWRSAYDQTRAWLDNLESQNAQRESAINNAIAQAYSNLIGNADNYYKSVLDAYGRSMGYVDQGYNEGREAAQMSKEEAIKLAQALYDMEAASQQRQTEKDLKGQYVSYMKGMRNLGQLLSAQGINGGASETAALNALNGYEANRTDLEEARLAALGALRQTQMQSDSAAEQSYLSALQNLISQRTQNQLGVENTRSAGESNFANMKNDAENTRSNQTLQAQQAFQNWASDLVNQRSGNESNYANAITGINSDRTAAAQNYQQMYAQALGNRTANTQSSAYMTALDKISEGGLTANTNVGSKNTTVKQTANKLINGTATKPYSKQSAEVQKKAVNMAYADILDGKKDLNSIADKDLKKAIKQQIKANASTNKKAKAAAKKYNIKLK